MKLKKLKGCPAYIILAFTAALAAFNYAVFVFPNSFAPAGVDGICTMIQHLLGTSIVLAPIAAGVIRGLLYAITLKFEGSSGGVDIIAAIVKKYRPHHNLMNIIFVFNVMIALCSYFVYNFKPEPVICSIIYSFAASIVSKSIETGRKENVRFEIITDDGDKLCREISETLGIPSTIIEAKGGYSGNDKKMVICVTDKESVPKLENLLKNYHGAISFEDTITASGKIKKY